MYECMAPLNRNLKASLRCSLYILNMPSLNTGQNATSYLLMYMKLKMSFVVFVDGNNKSATVGNDNKP